MAPGSLLRSFTRPPWPWLFAVAAVGVVLFSVGAGHAVLPAFCGALVGQTSPVGWLSVLDATLALNSPLRLIGAWALMLVAMMPPLLAMPMSHIWYSSRPAKRAALIALFALGYCGVWVAVGPGLVVIALLIRLLADQSAPGWAVLLALLWSASPCQQTALNRGHRLRRIGLFGWQAYLDGLVFGMTHGLWCIASCWAWMLVPLVSETWHLPFMLISGVIMLLERLSPPRPARWRRPIAIRWSLLRSRQTALPPQSQHG